MKKTLLISTLTFLLLSSIVFARPFSGMFIYESPIDAMAIIRQLARITGFATSTESLMLPDSAYHSHSNVVSKNQDANDNVYLDLDYSPSATQHSYNEWMRYDISSLGDSLKAIELEFNGAYSCYAGYCEETCGASKAQTGCRILFDNDTDHGVEVIYDNMGTYTFTQVSGTPTDCGSPAANRDLHSSGSVYETAKIEYDIPIDTSVYKYIEFMRGGGGSARGDCYIDYVKLYFETEDVTTTTTTVIEHECYDDDDCEDGYACILHMSGHKCIEKPTDDTTTTTTTMPVETTTTTTVPSGIVCGDGVCKKADATNPNSGEYYCPDDCGWFRAHRAKEVDISINGIDYVVNITNFDGDYPASDPMINVGFEIYEKDCSPFCVSKHGGVKAEDYITLGNGIIMTIRSIMTGIDRVSIGIVENTNCTDSEFPDETDGSTGESYYVKGLTKGMRGGMYQAVWDVCNNPETGFAYLSEDDLVYSYCDENEIATSYYTCPYGCEDGACVSEGTTTTTLPTEIYSGDWGIRVFGFSTDGRITSGDRIEVVYMPTSTEYMKNGQQLKFPGSSGIGISYEGSPKMKATYYGSSLAPSTFAWKGEDVGYNTSIETPVERFGSTGPQTTGGYINATDYFEFRGYRVYADLGSTDSWARIVIKDSYDNLVTTEVINRGADKSRSSVNMTIKLSSVTALDDGTVTTAYVEASPYPPGSHLLPTEIYGAEGSIDENDYLKFNDYKIYSDLGSDNEWARVIVKDDDGNTVATEVISVGSSKTIVSADLIIKVVEVYALTDGSVTNTLIQVGPVKGRPIQSGEIIYEFVFDDVIEFGGNISSPQYLTPVNIDLLGEDFHIVGVGSGQVKVLQGCVATITATSGIELGSYSVYSDLGGNDAWARVIVKDDDGNTVATEVINEGSDKTLSALGLIIKVTEVRALTDGTIVGVDAVISDSTNIEKTYDSTADVTSTGSANDEFKSWSCEDVSQEPPEEPETYTWNFYDGWNMFSFPVSDFYDSGRSEGCLEFNQGWYYDEGEYKEVESYDIGIGYWIKADVDEIAGCEVYINDGIPSTVADFPQLKAGWNLIGGPSESVKFSDVDGTCEVLTGPITWDASGPKGYKQSNYLEPGKAYWVAVMEDCWLQGVGGGGAVGPPAPPS